MADQGNGASAPRSFTGQSASAEEMLKSQTVGLVHLSDFRKRRAEVLEQKEREAHDKSLGRLASGNSRSATPSTGEVTDGDGPPKKKKKKPLAKSKLSFGDDDDETGDDSATATPRDSSVSRSGSKPPGEESGASTPYRMKANPNAPPPPKALTKAALEAEAQSRDALRKEFLVIQEAIKNTEILIPFVFFDGTSIPAGSVKVRKGDTVWLFLDRCRKVGAELGVPGANGASKARKDSRREWARISVDDLMLVKGDIIHYEFYYFIANRVQNFTRKGGLLFDYSEKLSPAKSNDNPLRRPNDEKLEGSDNDAADTKVVDRRWYEKNKHIYPASLWNEYEAGKEFEEKMTCTRHSLCLSHPTAHNRRCPACQTVLSNPDDAVSTILSPTEDYKTSVLSGLDPNTVMECAGRALGFWAYQSTQEMYLHPLYTKVQANDDLQATQEQLQKKNQELIDLYRQKSKKLSQVTNLYNLLKARAMRSQMQTTASNTALETLQGISSRDGTATLIASANPSQMPALMKPRTPRAPSFPISPEGIERLHRHQRSGTGSSRGLKTSDAITMPPPKNWLNPGGYNGKASTSSSNYQHHTRYQAQIPTGNTQHRTQLPHVSRLPTALSSLPPDDAILAQLGR
ncbi:Zinc finger RING-type [Penicillium taxi]|uniref:Zinc finger RING-type n=1 Tax=Penicillium taxi TaxID=168475 RepID=UPI002544E3AB|nr:Zinc finger RING-type [Penicillium taxi]KAJ5894793.1 Zinc finger RING-type [Penicillium taxi]